MGEGHEKRLKYHSLIDNENMSFLEYRLNF